MWHYEKVRVVVFMLGVVNTKKLLHPSHRQHVTHAQFSMNY